MVIRRTVFFLTLFVILFIVIAGNKLLWLMRAEKTTGRFEFQERGNALEQISVTSYEGSYLLGNERVWFKSEGVLPFKRGTPVTVLYQPQHPTDAKIYTLIGFWGSTIVNGGILFTVLLAIFVHPDIVPRRAKLRLHYKKPFIQVI